MPSRNAHARGLHRPICSVEFNQLICSRGVLETSTGIISTSRCDVVHFARKPNCVAYPPAKVAITMKNSIDRINLFRSIALCRDVCDITSHTKTIEKKIEQICVLRKLKRNNERGEKGAKHSHTNGTIRNSYHALAPA